MYVVVICCVCWTNVDIAQPAKTSIAAAAAATFSFRLTALLFWSYSWFSRSLQ